MDGVPINPGTIGGAGVQDIAPDLIERVEIVKGPRSSLYGSEAVGGVINIITRTPAR
jgi:vitamin B12 transporter